MSGGRLQDRRIVITGAAAGIGTILSTLAIGRVTDRYSFEPVLIGASILPLLATVLVFVLIRSSVPAIETRGSSE